MSDSESNLPRWFLPLQAPVPPSVFRLERTDRADGEGTRNSMMVLLAAQIADLLGRCAALRTSRCSPMTPPGLAPS